MVTADSVELGSGAFRYEALATWERLPDGMTLHECAGVAVDAEDLVYLLTRNVDNPVIVLEPDGGVLRSFGEGVFTNRTHSISVGPDGFLYCADDGSHTITKWTREGELVLTIGEPECPPSCTAASRSTARLTPPSPRTTARSSSATATATRASTVTRRRANSNCPGASPASTWGSSWCRTTSRSTKTIGSTSRTARATGCRSSTATAGRSRCGNNIHRPCGMTMGGDGLLYVGELNGVALMEGALGIGHRVSIYSREGELLARLGDPEEARKPGASSRRTGWRSTRAATSTSPRSPTRSAAATSTRLGSCAASRSCGGWGSGFCLAPLRRRSPYLTLLVRNRNPYTRQP